jgi:hypothetical protein
MPAGIGRPGNRTADQPDRPRVDHGVHLFCSLIGTNVPSKPVDLS